MGVLNVTPDSFSDGGLFFDREAAVARGLEMVAEGADIIDVGGESTRPGAEDVTADEERKRVLPVIERLAVAAAVPISIDTRKAEVAASAFEAGACIVNDVTAGSDSRMFGVVREAGAGMVLMHMKGDPRTMQRDPSYEDVVEEVRSYLDNRLDEATREGIDRESLAIDPGIGFGKTVEHNLTLLKQLTKLTALRRPLIVGTSRKSFIGKVLGGREDERLEGTAASVAWAAANGAGIVRVHDVLPMVRVVRMVDAISTA